jgi:hypothetical protein
MRRPLYRTLAPIELESAEGRPLTHRVKTIAQTNYRGAPSSPLESKVAFSNRSTDPRDSPTPSYDTSWRLVGVYFIGLRVALRGRGAESPVEA